MGLQGSLLLGAQSLWQRVKDICMYTTYIWGAQIQKSAWRSWQRIVQLGWGHKERVGVCQGEKMKRKAFQGKDTAQAGAGRTELSRKRSM